MRGVNVPFVIECSSYGEKQTAALYSSDRTCKYCGRCGAGIFLSLGLQQEREWCFYNLVVPGRCRNHLGTFVGLPSCVHCYGDSSFAFEYQKAQGVPKERPVKTHVSGTSSKWRSTLSTAEHGPSLKFISRLRHPYRKFGALSGKLAVCVETGDDG